ncbi:MAG TPA: hypothetical protein GX396_01560 [Tissierellia bacterium]|jgi:hypothetical protein|nr:hypothetical protein [Tissierellia bacterium]
MSDLNNFKDQLLYEIQKAFYDERGKGARYRLTLAGVPYIKSQLGEKANDIDELKKWLVEKKFLEDIEIWQDEIEFRAKMKKCCLYNICNSFIDRGTQPLSCPIANMFMSAIESELGLSPELLPVELDGGNCGIRCAKIADSAVVEAK